MGSSETVFVDESVIDFPIFVLFFYTKFPIFSQSWVSCFPIFLSNHGAGHPDFILDAKGKYKHEFFSKKNWDIQTTGKAFVDCATENFPQLCFSQPVVAQCPSRNGKQKN